MFKKSRKKKNHSYVRYKNPFLFFDRKIIDESISKDDEFYYGVDWARQGDYSAFIKIENGKFIIVKIGEEKDDR